MSRRLFVVVGAKGGVGATTIATKLVASFPTAAERMIVDADLYGKRSLASWYDLHEDLDLVHAIGSATVAKTKTGPWVMELTRKYEDGLIHMAGSIVRQLARLSEHALVVVDAPQPFAATVRPFINAATKIVVVTEPSRLGVAAAHALLAAMDRAGIASSRIALVESNVIVKRRERHTGVIAPLPVPVSAVLRHQRDAQHEEYFERFVRMLASEAQKLDDEALP